MISAFDLMLLGSLVSIGGVALLCQGKCADADVGPAAALTGRGLEDHARLIALAGARWLTVGVLTLFIAYAHGAEDGYLFGPWTDVMFHLLFVSTCWATTVYRINQTVQRTAMVPAVSARPRQGIGLM
jgi:hypothetical protein